MPTVVKVTNPKQKGRRGAPKPRRIGPQTEAQARRTAKKRAYRLAKKARKQRRMVGQTIDYSYGNLKEGVTPMKPYVDRAGKVIHPFQMNQIVASITTDGAGLLGTATSVPSNAGVTLNNQLFARIATLSGMYDRCRLKGLKFHFKPAVGTAKDGAFVIYFDYGGDAIAADIAAASRMQSSKECVPFRQISIPWRAQDPVDEQFIKTAGTVNFNAVTAHKFFMVGEGLQASTKLGYLWATAILEFTGQQ